MPLLCLLLATAVVINEVHYDPPGADGGAEFVELLNPGAGPVSLAGWRLEFANGADGPVWLVRWQGSAPDTLAAGARFLIVDRGWEGPPPDAEVRLDLQNGPDAVRLVAPDGRRDTVGWGDLPAGELCEGRPAPDVRGLALARRPDGQDTDDNAADLRPADPTPGRINWPLVAPEVVAVRWHPPTLAAPGRPVRATVTLANAGLADLTGARLRVQLGTATVTGSVPPLLPDSTATVAVTLRPARAATLSATLRLITADPADTVSRDLGRYQVGPAALRLTEVMAAPDAGGEWCEIQNIGTRPRRLAEMAVRDEDGAWRPLPDVVLAAGACLLLAEDATALASWLADLRAGGAPGLCDPVPPRTVPGWPALNNRAPAVRTFADRLYLGTADGLVLDHATLGLGSGEAPDGRSLERGPDGGWRPATAVVGATPGCLPPDPPEPDRGLTLAPNPFSARTGAGTVRAAFVVPDGRRGWELRIYDLWGGLVRDLGGDDLGAGPRVVEWDGRDEAGEPLPAGGYVAQLRWRTAGDGLLEAARRLLVIREARP